LLALEQLEGGKRIFEMVDFECAVTYEPNSNRHRIYLESMKRQQELYQALIHLQD
jgi:uncharacterized SAM-dependent methyltransferase